MIIREIQNYRVLDATTNAVTQRPIDYRLILAPLLYWRIELTERRLTLLEPQSGSLDAPDPNAFMVVVPPSYAAGQIFGIELLDTDWESEGFAVGDVLDMGMGPLTANSIFLRATIQGISGRTAMFVINTVYVVAGTLDTQNPFPLVAFLVNERFNIKAAFLRDSDTGFISPLNGQPFYVSGHANSLDVVSPVITNSTLRYNLRLYGEFREAIIDNVMPNARYLKSVYIEIGGTQFYAYRTSLNPTANTPTQAYPTRGKIVIDAESPNELRSLSFEANCLLLHPNRIEETNEFVSPGTLTIRPATSSSISAPSIPSPVKQRVCLLGQDSHHSSPSVLSSFDLVSEVTPPAPPTNTRSGADYVGVVVGQVDGKWVAVMTNRVPSTEPIYNLTLTIKIINLTRYDCVLLSTQEPSARLTGIYTVIIYGKVNNAFVPIASYNLNIRNPVSTPFPYDPFGIWVLGNLFPFEAAGTSAFGIRNANYDTIFYVDGPLNGFSYFYVPIPSGQEPPVLGTLLRPPSGYLLDILPLLDSPATIKAQLLCPDGTLLESQPEILINPPRPDNQLASITTNPDGISIKLLNRPPVREVGKFQLRVAIFGNPADHHPIDQAMLYAEEDYAASIVTNWYRQNGSRITIRRNILTGYSYQVGIDINGLPPGGYNIHVRSEFVHKEEGGYESFFVSTRVPIPEEPTGKPLPPIRCKAEIPVIRSEEWHAVVIEGDSISYISEEIDKCSLSGYCGCFTFVPIIPEDWIDVIGYFRGSIRGINVPSNAKHQARFRGRIIRLDDEYASEDFVSSLYRKEDIIRAYTTRYQIEILAHTPCDLTNLDILKLAERWDVVNRSNRMLPERIYNLRPAEVSIADSGEHAKVTITLKTLRWRDEYRRQA